MKYIGSLLLMAPLLMISCGGEKLPPGGSGLIEATEVMVSSESAGRLINIYFSEGDRIEIGDTICMVDTTTTALRLEQLRAIKKASETQLQIAGIGREQASYSHDLAKKEFERVESLIRSGSVNRQSFDQAENMLKQAELVVKQAEAAKFAAEADIAKVNAEYNIIMKQFSDCFPLAPISGRVVEDYIEKGELIGPGKSLIKVARLDTVFVKVYLPPADLAGLKIGQGGSIDPEDGRDEPISGTINWISSTAEFSPKNVQTKEARADLLYAVKLKISNPDQRLKIGMPVMVTID